MNGPELENMKFVTRGENFHSDNEAARSRWLVPEENFSPRVTNFRFSNSGPFIFILS